MSRSSDRSWGLLTVVALVAVGLVGTEILVRLVLPYSTPDTVRAYSLDYEAGPFTRIRLAPVGRLVEVDPGKARGEKPSEAPSERSFYINELGFRGPSFSPRKPEGTTRVCVVGGSAVFDQNVSDRQPDVGESWPNHAQTLLRRRGFPVEVINAGTPSHSTTDVLGRLIAEIWLYDPDFVVLYNGWNDIKNFRAWEVTPETPLSRVVMPFSPGSDPFRYYQGGVDRVLGRSQLYMKFRNAYFSARGAIGLEGYLPEGDVASDYGPYGLRQYGQNLRHFVDIVRNMGARPVLMTQASSIGLSTDLASSAATYQLLDPDALGRAYDDVHRVTRAVAELGDVPLLDAAARLNAETGNFSDHVHLSPAGSEAMARLLADFLEPLLMDTGGPGRDTLTLMDPR